MDRKEALKLLQLLPDADKETINRRYTTIFKKYRDADTDENGVPLSNYETAYNLLMGYTYTDPVEELRKRKQQEHPNPVLKWLKVDPDKARNLIYYYKWHVLGVVLALLLISWTIAEQVNRVDPDLHVLTVGAVFLEDQDTLTQSIKEAVPNVTEVQFQQILLGYDGVDPQMQMAMEQKLQLEMIAGKNDLIILDLENYKKYASFGLFVPLDERMQEFGTSTEAQADFVVELMDNEIATGEKHIYGIEVTNSRFLKENQMMGTVMVAAFSLTGEFAGNADALMKVLMMK